MCSSNDKSNNMSAIFIVIAVLLLYVQKGTTFTSEQYKKTLINSDEDCKTIFDSLDTYSQLKFVDASGKIAPGILEGHINIFGAYDECLAIDIPWKNMIGKYCTAHLDLADLFPKNQLLLNEYSVKRIYAAHNITQLLDPIIPLRKASKGYGFPLKVGICIPDRCGIESMSIKVDETSCTTRESNSELSTEAKIALYIIIVFVIVAVLSTTYDVIRTYYDRDPHHDILVAFSVYSNGKKLCQSSKNPDQLLCINGLKTLNIMWVITGHTYGGIMQGAVDNNYELYNWLQSYSSMLVIGATVAVDSFFTIGGLLSVYTLLRSKDLGLKTTIKSIPLLYLHRYLRLTPAFAVIILISWSSLNSYFANGPTWSAVLNDSESCKQSWWAALLYIQNYRTATQCIGPSWYLSVDMQLFILSPLIWIPLRKWPKQTLKAMFGLVLLGIVIPFGIAFYYKLPATLIGYPSNGYMDVYYMKTHTRFGTYVIGMIAGYYIYHAKQRKNYINPVALFWLWSLIIVVLYGCIYIGFPLVTKEGPSLSGIPDHIDEDTRWWNSIYVALLRPAWSIAIAVLIYLCVTGYGGPVNWFLSTGPMQFLGKLSYCIYLNHVIFVQLRINQTRTTIHFGNWEVLNILISTIMVIIPASIVHSLLFESPMICIEKIIFGKNKVSRGEGKTSKNVV